LGTDIARLTTIVSIYQAGEQLYDLFDKVCVIAEGRMAYFGPAKAARQYFIDMGYEPHNRQTTADFLLAGTFFSLTTTAFFLTFLVISYRPNWPEN
jgi:ATP-binding cassette subfamily G (WHITE) protein 2 (SNQ2)